MREGSKIIIIESFVSISREHVLSKLKARLWYYKSKYKKVSVLPIRIVKSDVSSVGPLSENKFKKKSFLFFLFFVSL